MLVLDKQGDIVSRYTIIKCPGSIPVPSKQTDSTTKAYGLLNPTASINAHIPSLTFPSYV